MSNAQTIKTLERIANNNYDDMHGTYDFDGIAEDLFAELDKLKDNK
jgi:hypothetical protein